MDQQTYKKILNEAKELRCTDELSIWSYGAEVQTILSKFSREMAHAAEKSCSSDPGILFKEIIQEINEVDHKNNSFLSRFYSYESKNQSCRNLLNYINKITSQLELKQANLIKDLILLQHMREKVAACREELICYIEAGQRRLKLIKTELLTELNKSLIEEKRDWCDRFKKRLDNLEISKTIVLQNLTQIDLLIKCDKKLIDQLGDCISITIPLLRNQLTLYMEMDIVKESIVSGKQLSKIIQNAVCKSGQKRKTEKDIFKKTSDSTETLKDAIVSLAKVSGELSEESAKELELLKKLDGCEDG